MSDSKRTPAYLRYAIPVVVILLVLGAMAQNSQAARPTSGVVDSSGQATSGIESIFHAIGRSANAFHTARTAAEQYSAFAERPAMSTTASYWCVDDNMTSQPTAPPCTNGSTFTSIELALLSAAPDDYVLLAGGTYLGTGNAVAEISIPLTMIGGYAGGTCGTCWTQYGVSTLSTLDGQGLRRGVKIDGPITVGLDNLTVANGGILNDLGTVSLTTAPVSPNTCTLNMTNGGTSNGLFDISSVSAACFPTGQQILDNNTSFIGSGVMRINGGTVSIGTVNTQSANADHVEFTSGTLTGVGTFTVNSTLTWNGGTMDGPFSNDTGTTEIPVGAAVTMAGTGTTKTLNQRTFNNHGTFTLNGTGTGTYAMGNLAVFNNYGSFVILNNDSVVYGTGEHPTFNNYGTISKSGGAGISTFGSNFFFLNSSGPIDVLTGTLSIDGGAAGGFNDTIVSAISVLPNTTLRFGGVSGSTHNLGPASSITGEGNVTFSNGLTTIGGDYNITGVTYITGGTVKFNSIAVSASTSMSGGTLAGDGEYDTDVLLWTGGTMNKGDTLAGETNISATGVMTVAGVSATKSLRGRVFNNNGHAVVNGTGTGTIAIGDQGIFNNTSTGVFDLQNNDSVLFINGTTAAIFINTGTIVKSGGALVSTIGSGSLSFENDGSVQVMTGTLSLDGGGTDSGSFEIDPRSELRFNGGTHLLGSSSSITGDGNVEFKSGTANVAGTYDIMGTSSVTGGTARFDSDADTTTAFMSSGTLTGTGTVNMTYLAWQGGIQDGPGTTNIDASGILTFTGVSTSKYLYQRTLNNNGLALMNSTGTGYLYMGNHSTFNNNLGAVFDIENNDSILYANGTNQANFNNVGTVKKSGGAGTSTLSSGSLLFNNDGAVQVLTGTLSLDGGGASEGTFTMSSQATLRFNGGNHTLQPGSSLTGSGNLTFNAGAVNIAGVCNMAGITNVTGGTVNFNSNATSASTNLINGTIGGSGIYTVTDTLNWSGGYMVDAGITSVPVGAVLNLNGVSTQKRLRERTFDLGGIAYMNGTGTGTLYLGTGAIFHVLTGGTFNIQNNDSISYENGAAPIFSNDGTFRKAAGTGTSNVGLSTLVFNNSGTVDVLSGVINFGPNFNQYAGTTSLSGGNMSSTGTLNFLDGLLTGGGVITGTVANSGEIRPGSAIGVLTVNGAYRQGVAGAVTIQIGGPNPGTDFDQLHVLGTATLSGTLNIQMVGGYVPSVGNTIQIMPYNSHGGTFTSYTGLVLSGRSLLPTYNSTNLSLVVVAGAITPTPIPTASTTPVGGTPGTPTPTPTGCVVNFVDVSPADYYYEPVQYLACHAVINGYNTNPPCDSGTPCFKPVNNTTRGQLTKIVVLGEGMAINTSGGPHFEDVVAGSTFYDYVETSYNAGLINGYPCGGVGEPCVGPGNRPYFRPNALVTRGQLTKIVVLAEGWTLQCPASGHFSDVPHDSSFYCYIETAVSYAILNGYSDGTFRPGNPALRGQISKIVYLAITHP